MKLEVDTYLEAFIVDGVKVSFAFLCDLVKKGEARRIEIRRHKDTVVLTDLKTPPYLLHNRLTAYDFGQTMVNGSNGAPSPYTFSIDRDRAAAALRKLADRIEAGAVTMGEAHVETVASADDYGVTDVRLKLHELLPP